MVIMGLNIILVMSTWIIAAEVCIFAPVSRGEYFTEFLKIAFWKSFLLLMGLGRVSPFYCTRMMSQVGKKASQVGTLSKLGNTSQLGNHSQLETFPTGKHFLTGKNFPTASGIFLFTFSFISTSISQENG